MSKRKHIVFINSAEIRRAIADTVKRKIADGKDWNTTADPEYRRPQTPNPKPDKEK